MKSLFGRAPERISIKSPDIPSAKWGEAQAKQYLEDLRRLIAMAAEFPGMGSEALGLPREYRKLRSGSHRVIYRCTETQLIVVRILHSQQDVPDDFEDFE